MGCVWSVSKHGRTTALVAGLASLSFAACGAPGADEGASAGESNAGALSAGGKQQPVCRVGHEHDGHHHANDDDDDPRSYGRDPHHVVRAVVCHGVDDTAAVQDAINHADEIQLPFGTCAVSGLTAVKKPLTII